MKRILIACEKSQKVAKAFRALGFDAYSNDLQECTGGHPEFHLQMDAREALGVMEWDGLIAHPVCTRMANSGVCWLEKRGLWKEMEEGCDFFNVFSGWAKKTGKPTAVENPIPHKYAVKKIGKYSQIIQPWMFGHPEKKATCLWLFNGLPRLVATNNVKAEMLARPKKEAQRIHYTSPGPRRAEIRSVTFDGIAQAMAEQWSKII